MPLCCALAAFSGPPALSLHTAAGFTLRLRQLTFRLIIVVCDISKRIMRMKCDKNYFHVTPEHLTSDGLVQHRPLGLFRSPCEVIATKLLFNRKKNQVWILKNVF